MAQFVFQLDGVLQHRHHIEREKQRIVAGIQAENARLHNDLRLLDLDVQARTAEIRQNHLTGELNLNFLAAHRRYMNAMQRKAMTLAQAIAQVQLRLQKAQKELSEAAVEKKILEKLKEKQHGRWKSELDRRELLQQDEISMQLSYRNHAEDLEENRV